MLNTQNTQQITELNILLSSISIAVSNAKAYHWLITGKDFFELHEQFSKLYDFFGEHQDKIAERILSLKAKPIVGYSNYLKHTFIKESVEINEDSILKEVLNSFDLLIVKACEVKKESVKLEDDETDSYMQDLIYEIQKLHWQYTAQLGDR
jgi:starvation-inducible DNA-binding protein